MYNAKAPLGGPRAWVPAFAGIHASGRAEQHLELLDPIFDRE